MTKINQNIVTAGKIAGQIHRTIAELMLPGTNLLTIDKKIAELIDSFDAKAAFLGYKNYPAVSCLSVNSAVVHAIPKDYFLKSGDILSVDFGVEKEGWIVDTAWSYPIGQTDAAAIELLAVTEEALHQAISVVKPDNHIGDIGQIIQKIVERSGFYVIRDLSGHGVGRELQTPPSIPNFGRSGTGAKIKEGMILAIEPITALEPVKLTIDSDNWTVRARPDVVCAHFEHTVFVTNNGPVVLTDFGN